MVKVAAISYLNTIPFIYGLEHSPVNEELQMCRCVPSEGARMVADGTADIGIIPVAAGMQIPGAEIVTDFCIGAVSPVLSVLLCSPVPLQEIRKIHLDTDSRSSVMLCRILCRHYWKIEPEFEKFDFSAHPIDAACSYLIIGDKAMANASRFSYVYDMAQEWISFKGKPFVFACWFAGRKLDPGFLSRFNSALAYGVSHIDAAVDRYSLPFSKEFSRKYLTENISYNFDKYKREGLNDFWTLALEELKSKVRW